MHYDKVGNRIEYVRDNPDDPDNNIDLNPSFDAANQYSGGTTYIGEDSYNWAFLYDKAGNQTNVSEGGHGWAAPS